MSNLSTGKAYKQIEEKVKIISIIPMMLLILLLASCNNESIKNHNTSSSNLKQKSFSDVFSRKSLIESATQAVLSYQDIYYSVIPPRQDISFIIPDADMQQIDNRIAALGYSVIVNDGNLTHPNQVSEFYREIKSGHNANILIFQVYKMFGSLTEYAFKYISGHLYIATICAGWDSNSKISTNVMDFSSIDKYTISPNGYFLYHTTDSISKVGYSSGFRVKQLPQKNWALYRKYIEPIGYVGNDLFLANWNISTVYRLNFNDLYEYVNVLDHNQVPDSKTSYMRMTDTFGNSVCSATADQFEKLITKYFPVSVQELHKHSVYDAKRKAYPYSINYVDDNVDLNLDAEVIQYKSNPDNSITMVVNLPDLYDYSDCGIQHVLTIKPSHDGGFKYISNIVTINHYRPGWFPKYTARITRDILNRDN